MIKLPSFRRGVAHTCENPQCERVGHRVGLHLANCEVCRQPLGVVPGWNVPRLFAAMLLGALLLGSVLGGVHASLAHFAARRQAALLARCRQELESALADATQDDFEGALAAVQARFHLTPEQARELRGSTSPLAQSLPNGFRPETRHELEALVRSSFADQLVSPEEQAALDRYVAEQKLSPKAARAIEEDLERRIREADESIARGKELVDLERYAEALRELQAATEKDPGNSIAWADLGAAAVLAGNPGQAQEAYRKALALDPQSWLAHYNLALLCARRGDREAAFDHLRRALAALPDTADRERRAMVRGLLEEPSLGPLRDDPRFADLLGAGALKSAGSR